MSFIPHTNSEIHEMLKTIGVQALIDLFDEIPQHLLIDKNGLKGLPHAISEMEVARLMKKHASKNKNNLCFVGAGAYEHHIPAPIWEIVGRGEIMTAYTPYQAEASQGTLQTIYEYQTMMASLTGMDVANASLYDGGSGLAEAILMAVRANKKSTAKKILMPSTVNPYYRQAVKTIVTQQNIEIIDLPIDDSGITNIDSLHKYAEQDITALVIPQPNFFGCLENVDALTGWANEHKALAIAVVNPTSLALLKEPGAWGRDGVDIVCGEGQPFGSPLSMGGPYFGFLCCKQAYVRQIPGRVIGKTTDVEGRAGYVLTLQAREQHIRRSKATSNICTNEGMMVAAAAIYMSLLGPKGIQKVAQVCHENTRKLVEDVLKIKKVSLKFNTPYFHEVVLHLPISAKEVIKKMDEKNILAGFDLGEVYSGMKNDLLVCCTETKTDEDIELYIKSLNEVLK